MYTPISSYSSPYTSSYTSLKRFTSSPSSLPPLSSKYSSSRYSSNYSSTSKYSSPTVTTSPRYSSNTYSSANSSSRDWRSTYSSPSFSRTDTSLVSRRPSYTSSSGTTYRSNSISSLSSTSFSDNYRSGSVPVSYRSSSDINDDWTPRASRINSISSTESSGYSSNYKVGTSPGDSKLAGRVGLNNLGNTCFMNAVLQCLCHTQPLVDYCKLGTYSSEINHRSPTSGELIRAFANLVSVLWNNNPRNSVSPDKLKRELQKYAPRFSGCSQQDAQELLRYLLQGLHDDINRITTRTSFRSTSDRYTTEYEQASDSWRLYQTADNSKIVDLFGGQLRSTLKCMECNNSSVTFDPFWDLSLPIPENSRHITLQQCFRLFTSPEYLEGAEKPLCERCNKKTRSTKQLEIYKFPTILVIHLKRFSGQNYRNKLNVTVDYTVKNLELSSFAANSSPDNNCTYDLYGIVDHFGTSSSGHYTSKCKNLFTEEWTEFNDSMVEDTTPSNLVTDKAYLLFYEQKRGRSSSKL